MRDALNRRFDVVLAEGDITHLHIGFKGTMNALFLRDLPRRRTEDCVGAWRAASLAAGFVTATAC